VLRVWTLDLESILRGGLGTLPLAPLAGVAASDLPAVIDRIKHRLDREATSEQSGLLWAATNILMGLVFPRDLAARLLQGVRAMKESVTYQAILDEGRAEGEAKGLVMGEKQLLLRLGRRRLGEPDASVIAAIEAIADARRIEQMGDRLIDAASWEELIGPA